MGGAQALWSALGGASGTGPNQVWSGLGAGLASEGGSERLKPGRAR